MSRPVLRRCLLLTLLILLAGAGGGPATARNSRAPLSATIEWTILGPSPPGPAHTLLLDIDTPGIGPIEHPDCATWDGATLTLYDMTRPVPTSGCVVAGKSIRRHAAGAGDYALTWPEGSGAFWEHLLYPGDTYPVTVGADGGLRVGLP